MHKILSPIINIANVSRMRLVNTTISLKLQAGAGKSRSRRL